MKNPLSPTEAEPFRQRLIAMRRHVKGESTQDELADLTHAAGSADAMDASSMYECVDILGALSQSKGETLAQIQSALERIKDGAYGACEECDAKIPKARLEAMPQTPHCIACQRRIEAGSNGVRKNVRAVLENEGD